MYTSDVKVTYEVDETKTHYLNVDLDVWSRSRLETLAEALGTHVSVLYVGPDGGRQCAHFSLRGAPLGADASSTILGLVRAIEALSAQARRLWRGALVREFNVGVQAAAAPSAFELRINPEAVEAVARVGAGIALTVYAPQGVPQLLPEVVSKRPNSSRKKRSGLRGRGFGSRERHRV